MHTLGLVPKARRPRFTLDLVIHDLNNVPLVSGSAYVKWHLRNSSLADSRGHTPKAPIKDHRVTWHYSRTAVLKLHIDRASRLSASYLDLEILQEYSGRERIVLGSLEINLAEYANRQKETRRYLMQDSKINSTLQVSVELTQMSGETNFITPELKPAQVFSGLAGVVMDSASSSAAESTDHIIGFGKGGGSFSTEMGGSMSLHSREQARIQDIYRRTLAASWQTQAGELNPVECIEDIFSGGDGWLHRPRHPPPHPAAAAEDSSSADDKRFKNGRVHERGSNSSSHSLFSRKYHHS